MGHTSSFVKSSKHFVQQIRATIMEEINKMVSFDVKSLFTRVPMDKTMDAIVAKLNDDDTLDKRTTMSTKEICKLTKLCQWNQLIFVQEYSLWTSKRWGYGVPIITSHSEPIYGVIWGERLTVSDNSIEDVHKIGWWHLCDMHGHLYRSTPSFYTPSVHNIHLSN